MYLAFALFLTSFNFAFKSLPGSRMQTCEHLHARSGPAVAPLAWQRIARDQLTSLTTASTLLSDSTCNSLSFF